MEMEGVYNSRVRYRRIYGLSPRLRRSVVSKGAGRGREKREGARERGAKRDEEWERQGRLKEGKRKRKEKKRVERMRVR